MIIIVMREDPAEGLVLDEEKTYTSFEYAQAIFYIQDLKRMPALIKISDEVMTLESMPDIKLVDVEPSIRRLLG